MVTAKAQYDLKNADRYFGEHLSVGDYSGSVEKPRGGFSALGALADSTPHSVVEHHEQQSSSESAAETPMKIQLI